MTGTIAEQVLDNPVWAALSGAHQGFAERHGHAARYQQDVSPFHAVADADDPAAWADLAALAGPGAVVWMAGDAGRLPAGWTVDQQIDGVQLVDDAAEAAVDPEALRLTTADVPEMLDLVARTRPGPFLTRTVELGHYLGIRRGGALVAMAGERMRLPGWIEISAVCTAPEARGQGLAGRLIQAVVAGIRARGDRPLLHAAADNTGAIRLYEALGFTLRRQILFRSVRTPDADPAAG
ncbi:GNAT family N-acetyltransferase [Micromonospora craterilacus]|uniref:GNAT family N-acetyltransferase n=1 Tax=Micromonospora craterilacus TaxID=1655439 RepID=A0A2W2FIW0_9ACTN|nr:GNAT family N-acetyltransferase [Micromonospora craterilacus]PZG21667.1 GNAT family N-acetyltransferase [Micromonospora craterilacus]